MTRNVRIIAAEVVNDARAVVGEGALWDFRSQRLMWVDIPAGEVHELDPADGSDRVQPIGQPVGAVGLRSGGGYVLAVRDGFAALEGGRMSMLADVELDRPDMRMNDGKVDPAGRFWAGTMALDSRPRAGGLYRIDAGHRVERVLGDLTISNGMDWSDSGQMYFIDSAAGGVDVFDFAMADGSIAGRRRVVEIPESLGVPDGMTLDAEGLLWVAIWDGSAVRRYRPDGSLDAEVRLPVSQPTSCAFGDDDLDTLYITTARDELSPEEAAAEPHAGAIFACRPGVQGRRADEYRG
ncbi:MAG: SMP-30/gluconolactonase/LRE family protein [Chloroflexota bacterium]|nr:SMP-30/gluconolactonase/LRE family protein [Chloroflexota bacterium]